MSLPNIQSLPVALLVLGMAASLSASVSSPHPEPRMSYIENDAIRLGVDLSLGGAITWISKRGGENIVNSMDLGRQIQMSYYSGPVPFASGGQEPSKHWAHLGWNPIQAGDDFGNGSRTLDHRNDGHSLYTKCIPMQWPLKDVPGECTFECWLEMEGSVVKMRSRLNNARPDKTQYPARLQELPAVYLNAPFHRLVSYVGTKPFTGDAVSDITRPADKPSEWAHWIATERWAALINDEGWGLGLWNPSCLHFIGGFDGKPGPNDPRGGATGYIAGQTLEMLDHNITHEYHCELILGSLDQIRDRVKSNAGPPSLPSWKFDHDRQGWRFNNASDTGWPLKNVWHVLLEKDDPQLISPHVFFDAGEAPVLTIRAAFKTRHQNGTVFWRRLENGRSVEGGALNFPIQGDGVMRDHIVRLSDSKNYHGKILEFRIDPVPSGADGDWVKVESVGLGK